MRLTDARGNSKIRLKNGRVIRRVIDMTWNAKEQAEHAGIWYGSWYLSVRRLKKPEPHGRNGLPIEWEEV